jgi:thioredoxin-dependent peroxiredoxin
MPAVPEVGRPAPDFTLPGIELTGGRVTHSDYTLSAQRGHPVVLAFYPGDETTVCTKQMCAYSSELEMFTELKATVWGISPQDLQSHHHFARKHALRVPLLADTSRQVIRDYGIGLGSLLRRAVFIIDAQGVVRWKHVALLGLTYRRTETIAAQLNALNEA